MNWTVFAFLLLLTCVGCGKEEPVQAVTTQIPASGPITIEAWKAIEEEEKFSSDVLARLRTSNPTLKSKKAWDQFYEEVVKPEFKKFRSS